MDMLAIVKYLILSITLQFFKAVAYWARIGLRMWCNMLKATTDE